VLTDCTLGLCGAGWKTSRRNQGARIIFVGTNPSDSNPTFGENWSFSYR